MLFEAKPWRKPPFRRGRRYRVLKDFPQPGGEPFHAGDVLEFRRSGHSIYDSMDGCFFIQAAPAQRWRRWDISTRDDIGIWPTLFELMPRQGRGWLPRLLLATAAAALLALVLATWAG